MISETQFLDALTIVNQYTAQIQQLAHEAKNYNRIIDPKLLNKSILSCKKQFGTRTVNALLEADFVVIEDLIKVQSMDLYKTEGIGEKGYEAVKEYMYSIGIYWY